MPKLSMPPEKLKELIAEREAAKAIKGAQFNALYAEAYNAGLEAGKAARPAAMLVGSPSSPFGNAIDASKPMYYVSEGACGFAWVNIRPGNSPFANWLKAKRLARPAYAGGVEIWISAFGQSVDRKDAMAQAMAKVFSDAGIKAYAGSRMD